MSQFDHLNFSSSLDNWCICNFYSKSFKPPPRNLHIIVWGIPILKTAFLKDKLRSTEKLFSFLSLTRALIFGRPFLSKWAWLSLFLCFWYHLQVLQQAGSGFLYFYQNFLWIAVQPWHSTHQKSALSHFWVQKSRWIHFKSFVMSSQAHFISQNSLHSCLFLFALFLLSNAFSDRLQKNGREIKWNQVNLLSQNFSFLVTCQ